MLALAYSSRAPFVVSILNQGLTLLCELTTNGFQWKVKVQLAYGFTKSHFCRTILHHYRATHYLRYLDVVTSTPQYPEFSGTAKI